MDGTVEVKIWFICSLQRRRELPDSQASLVIQLHDNATLVSLAGVPKDHLIGGILSPAVLWQAETMFLQRQGQFYPEHNVIAWEAHYHDTNGPLLSRFRVLLSSQED